MSDSGGIRAGQAYVEMFLKDEALTKGLQAWQGKLRAFGSSVKQIGAEIAGMGLALEAALAAAATVFANTGAALSRMSLRTGISVEALSQLGYAADQSGVSMESLETGLRKLQNRLGIAEQGNMEAIQSFAKLGIAVGQLRLLAPEQQFAVLAERIDRIRNPALQAAIAIEMFGRSGTDLLPLLNGGAAKINALVQAAKDLGYTMTQADAESAEKLEMSLKALWDTVKLVTNVIGSALAPVLQPLIDNTTRILVNIGKWIGANRDTVTSLTKIVAIAAGAGVVLFALGGGFAKLNAILSGLGVVMGFVTSPFVLIAGLVGGAVFAFVKFTSAGQAMFESVKAFIAPIAEIFSATFGGIKDAISAGDLGLAATIAFTGLRVAMLQGVAQIADAVGGALGDFMGSLGTQLAEGNLAGVWNTIVSQLAASWAGFSEGVVKVFAAAVNGILTLWANMQKTISSKLLEEASGNGWIGRNFGGDIRKTESDRQMLIIGRENTFNAENAARKKEGKALLPMPADLATDLASLKSGTAAKRGLEELQKNAAAGIDANLSGIRNAAKDVTDGMQAAAEKNVKDTQAALNKHIAGGRGQAHGEIADLQKQLADLLNQAAKEHAAANANAAAKVQHGADAAISMAKLATAGTFNAMSAGRMAGGGDNRTHRLLEQANRHLAKIRDNPMGHQVFGG